MQSMGQWYITSRRLRLQPHPLRQKVATESFSKFIATNTITCIRWGIIDFLPNTQCGQCVVVVVVFIFVPKYQRKHILKKEILAQEFRGFGL